MKNIKLLIMLSLPVCFAGCGGSHGSKSNALVQDPYVFCLLDEEQVVGDSIIKLSDLVDDYEMVVFENSDSAIFKARKPVISDNYIAVIQGGSNPVLLFDKRGRYVSQIGAVGRGPGEYIMPYDALIDEKRGVVYIAQMLSNAIQEYNLKGEYINSHQVGELKKPAVFLNGDGSVSVASIAFSDLKDPMSAATLDPVNDSVTHIVYPPLLTNFTNQAGEAVGFNNEMWVFKNTDNNTYMLTNNDTLYAYDYANNTILPRAFLKEKNVKDKDSWYIAMELPQAVIYSVEGPDERILWYDKGMSELFKVAIVNDYLGNASLHPTSFRNGYFAQIYEPGMLLDQIEETWLPENDMTDAQRKHLEQIQSSIDQEGNNIMFIGKLKSLPN